MHTESRATARGVLAVLLALAVGLAGLSISSWKVGYADAPSRGPGDFALYKTVAARIHAGDSYYVALGRELADRGYPTQSVFNWRMPLPLAIIGHLPDPRFGQAALCGLALVAGWLAFGMLERAAGLPTALLGAVALSGALMPCCLGDLFYEPVLWSGTLILLSIGAYARGSWKWGVAAGLAALFCRELAAPYVVICGVMALGNRNWREAACWFAGMVAYFGFFAWHVASVIAARDPAGHAHVESWLQLGGAAFVISTAQMNAYLVLMPQWASALFLMASLAGFAAWRSDAGMRAGLTAAAYVAALGFVGHSFNQYWGILIAPLLSLGFAMSPHAMWRLSQVARGSTDYDRSTMHA